jgi:hypothetical protein
MAQRGRPRADIDLEEVEELLNTGANETQVAEQLQVFVGLLIGAMLPYSILGSCYTCALSSAVAEWHSAPF